MGRGRNNKKKNMSVHHLLWSKSVWSKNYYCSKLRSHFYCRCYLKRASVHNEIHKQIDYVPVLSERDAALILEYLNYASRCGSIDRADSGIQKLSYLIRILEDIGEEDTKQALIKQKEILLSDY